jgi:nucleoside-diphosphate-sugar epimerase
MDDDRYIVTPEERILVTGSGGFVGPSVVRTLLDRGYSRCRCLVRPSSDRMRLQEILREPAAANVEILEGNLLSPEDCAKAVEGVSVILHLAAGRGEKSYSEAFLNSVVTTRNLLDAAARNGCLKRFVNVSSFTVYSPAKRGRRRPVDESCDIECTPSERGEAYCFAKVRQEDIVREYQRERKLPVVTVRPGVIYGPGNRGIPGRVGIGTFGIFLHLGGSNRMPLTYVDNCAEAIVLSGITKGVDGETFNVVDDDPPTSREFLRIYKKRVRPMRSVYLPHDLSYFLCFLWERYSKWSEGQLPNVFNRKKWHSYWSTQRYSNAKIKRLLNWTPRVPFDIAISRYVQYQRKIEGLDA